MPVCNCRVYKCNSQQTGNGPGREVTTRVLGQHRKKQIEQDALDAITEATDQLEIGQQYTMELLAQVTLNDSSSASLPFSSTRSAYKNTKQKEAAETVGLLLDQVDALRLDLQHFPSPSPELVQKSKECADLLDSLNKTAHNIHRDIHLVKQGSKKKFRSQAHLIQDASNKLERCFTRLDELRLKWAQATKDDTKRYYDTSTRPCSFPASLVSFWTI